MAGGQSTASSAKIKAKNFDVDARGEVKANGLNANCLNSVWISGDSVHAPGAKLNGSKVQFVADGDVTLKGVKVSASEFVYIATDTEIVANTVQIVSPEVRMQSDDNISIKGAKLDVKSFSIETPPTTWYVPELDARSLKVANSEKASFCLNGADLADEVDMSVTLTKADTTTCNEQPPAPQ